MKLFHSFLLLTGLVQTVVSVKPAPKPAPRPNMRPVAPPVAAPISSGTCTGKVPKAGTALIDGLLGDWDVTDASPDFFAQMWEAGRNNKTPASKAYARYDCATSTLCVLVKAATGVTLINSPSDMWFREDSISQSPIVALAGIKTISEGGVVVGWEGCFTVPKGCYSKTEIHAAYGNSQSTSTGKPSPGSGLIGVNLQCSA
jgi:hypothetical protein